MVSDGRSFLVFSSSPVLFLHRRVFAFDVSLCSFIRTSFWIDPICSWVQSIALQTVFHDDCLQRTKDSKEVGGSEESKEESSQASRQKRQRGEAAYFAT